jgi:FemAB-related protein (PEP-CTERM system-associated)
MRDLGTPVYSPRLFAETLRAFGADACIVIVSSKDAGPMAGAVAVSFRDTTLVPWASSLREFRHLCPNMLLYWTLLERATLERRRVFDFGRSSPGGGTHQFKLQWGAGESPLFWEYAMLGQRALPDHSPTNPKFSAMIALWQRLPMPIANAIGPAIVRNIP